MNPFIKGLQEEYASCMKAAEDIRKKYDGSPKDMPSDEEERWSKAIADADAVYDKIQTAIKEHKLRAGLDEAIGRTFEDGKGGPAVEAKDEKVDERAYKDALRKLFSPVSMGGGVASLEKSERKALQMDDPVRGGYLVMPLRFVEGIIAAAKNLTFMRQLCTVLPPIGPNESYGIQALDTDVSDATWTSELGTGSEDDSARFGRRHLKPNPLAQRIKISRTLLRQGALDVEAFIQDRIAYKFSVVEENAFLNGTGLNQPLGIMVANADGVSTGRDIACGASLDGDDLIDAMYGVKGYHAQRGVWLFHRDAMAKIRKLKDSQNQYVWSAGIGLGNTLTDGSPQTILGRPVYTSEYVPNTFTNGNYVGMFFNPEYYNIGDSLDFTVQVLDELYAATNQVGYIARKETDGMPVLEEAFARLKISA